MHNYRFAVLTCVLIFSVMMGCKRDPLANMPVFSLRLADSITLLNTGDIPEGDISMFVHFDSDCGDCQKETKTLLSHMQSLKNVKIYFLSVQDMAHVQLFRDYFKLGRYPNVSVGQDTAMAFPKHFRSAMTPFLALYDKRNKLRVAFEGKADIQKLLATIKEIE